MDVTYTTQAEDMVDAICKRHYGHTTAGIVEKVLSSNPGLSGQGPLLPAGISIVLPDIGAPKSSPQIKSTVNLWD
ncbi:MAG: tail protein X [Verrucomicrobiota bacterium]|nr:tail protein X [Verrucomicrobiota bacterium]